MIIKEQTPEYVAIDAAAKINLFLEILNKRPDGFHNINSAFQAISLFDKLEFTLTPQPGIELEITNLPELPADETNLIVRAFRQVEKNHDLPQGLKVKLTKNIPMAAGLGGGSADAAATIWACNLLYSLNMSQKTMAETGSEIGSDIPFFFSDGQAIVSGRGEIIKETEFPLHYELILINPGLAVSTAEAYSSLRMGLTKTKDPFTLAYCRSLGDLLDSLRMSGNDFEKTQLEIYPVLSQIKKIMEDHGALLSRISGSGPTIFGIFEKNNTPEIKTFERNIRADWRRCYVRPITFSGQAL